jgi:hypothetical protein
LQSETQRDCWHVKPLRQDGSQLFAGAAGSDAGAGVGAAAWADTQPPSALHEKPAGHAGEQTGVHSPRRHS